MVDAFAGLVEQRDALASGSCSSRELVDAALERHAATHVRLNAVVHSRGERAQRDADEADARRASGKVLSALDGVAIVLKDNMVMRGEPTTCSSRILEGYSSPFDACVVERLQAAGAVVLGAANMDEFAMGSSTENTIHGVAHNPWDLERTCGGSSGGSAASVSAGIVGGALGSDTGGSIRQPASFCGVTGLKPTYGRVSRWGLVAFASSLDQIGTFTHSAADAALLLETIAGHDPRDSTSIPEPVPQYSEGLDGDVEGLTIGLPKEYFDVSGGDPEVLERVRAGVADLEAAGAKVVEVSLPRTRYGVPAYYLIANAEASSNLARFDGARYGRRAEGVADYQQMYERSRSEGFGDEVKRRIMLGTYVLSAGYFDAYYKKAQQVRTLLRDDFDAAFSQCDVIATPTSPETAFALGEKIDDPVSMYLSDIYTVSANLAGIPGISVPCGLTGGLPVGLQLLGRVLDEGRLLRVADAYQRRTDHHLVHPPEFA
ncbi:MAG: Asp-tRNA(Asn)/Glu-tRNA(Gln) amidotransferase subunit GatA [Myxococcota bacterium]|jgi:aspartyl-tRNA(Asn)/glutamyl-tRNA(Gln) amidotransferase subunit A|nr:Asp-tRNA(Asn)/Glu-tRNA(Gln) amidotransferase subunit GatA [Myxococcota bacterium]